MFCNNHGARDLIAKTQHVHVVFFTDRECCANCLVIQVPLETLGTEKVCAALIEAYLSVPESGATTGSGPEAAVSALVEAIRHDRLGALLKLLCCEYGIRQASDRAVAMSI